MFNICQHFQVGHIGASMMAFNWSGSVIINNVHWFDLLRKLRYRDIWNLTHLTHLQWAWVDIIINVLYINSKQTTNPFYPNWSSKPHLVSQARATATIKSNFIELSLKYYSITMLFLFQFSECSLMNRQGGWRWPQSSITYWFTLLK